MNDKALRQLVLDELDYEPSIDAADIGVTAENGVITLSGHVPSYAQKFAAEHATWRVRGVKAIAQEIEVRLPGDKKVNDDEIADRAVAILSWSTVVPRETVKVKVAKGWVTLTGRLHWNFQRMAAEAAIRKLSGVIGVSNQIELTQTANAGDMRRRITDALKRHAEVEAERIRIDVRDDGRVTIEGDVDDWEERQAVERAVWAAPGVKSVDDRMRIS